MYEGVSGHVKSGVLGKVDFTYGLEGTWGLQFLPSVLRIQSLLFQQDASQSHPGSLRICGLPVMNPDIRVPGDFWRI